MVCSSVGCYYQRWFDSDLRQFNPYQRLFEVDCYEIESFECYDMYIDVRSTYIN